MRTLKGYTANKLLIAGSTIQDVAFRNKYGDESIHRLDENLWGFFENHIKTSIFFALRDAFRGLLTDDG